MPTILAGNSTPGSGGLIAVYGGSPAGTVTLDGAIQHAEVVETFGTLPAAPPGTARRGDPLIDDGVTIWLQGVFPAAPTGVPTDAARSAILATWDTLRAKLLSSGYELFLHYQPSVPLYRKHRLMGTVVLRAHWADPLGLVYVLGATTTDRTLYTNAPGLG
jgi:hypothetical protein